MPLIDPRLIIVFIWLLFSSALTYGAISVSSPHRARSGDRPKLPQLFEKIPIFHNNKLKVQNLWIILSVSLMIRLVPALILPRGAAYEMHVFQEAANLFRNGENVYITKIAHPYLPFLIYWLAFSDWLADQAGLFFIFWLKSISILADVGITGIVFFALKRTAGQEMAYRGSWLYAVNPITMLVAAYQGQFDTLALFFLLSSWYQYKFYQSSNLRLGVSALFLGIGIVTKTWPVIFLPIIWLRLPTWRKRLGWGIISGLVVALSLVLYEALFPGSWNDVVRRSLGAGAISGWWGYSSLVNVFVELTGNGRVVFNFIAKWGSALGRVIGLLIIWMTRKRSSLYALLVTTLGLFTFVPNLGLQGLSWVIPLAIIVGRIDELGWYMAGAGLHMTLSYWGLHLTNGFYQFLPKMWADIIIQLSSLSAWIIILLWWSQEFSSKQFLRPIRKQTSASK